MTGILLTYDCSSSVGGSINGSGVHSSINSSISSTSAGLQGGGDYSLSQFDLIFVDRVFWLAKIIKDKEYETELNETADGVVLIGRADVADNDFGAGDAHERRRDRGDRGIDLRKQAGDPFGDWRRVRDCRRHFSPRVHTDSDRTSGCGWWGGGAVKATVVQQ